MSLIEKLRFDSLIELARTHFDANLLNVEARVLAHSVSDGGLPIPVESEPRPNIRSEFLRWLATDPDAGKFIDPKGIRVWSATIPAGLDLRGCRMSHALHFLSCALQGELCLATADLPALYIIGGESAKDIVADGVSVHGPVYVKKLKASGAIRLLGAQIQGNLDFAGTVLLDANPALILDAIDVRGSAFFHDGFRSSGEVRMLNARVRGDLGFSNAVLDATGRALSLDKVIVEGMLSLAGLRSSGMVGLPGAQVFGDLSCAGANLQSDDIALNLATATIRGHVYLREGFSCSGKINLHSAQVGNSLDCSGAVIKGAKPTLSLEEASVRGTVYLCDGFHSAGSVQLTGAQLHGNLACDGATLTALYCANMKLEGDLIWTSIQNPQETSLWLNGASIKTLRDDWDSRPAAGGLHIDGLTYQELTLHGARTAEDREKNSLAKEYRISVADRIGCLGLQLQEDMTEPQPWMQLAGLLKAKGDNPGSKRVIFEMRRCQAASSSAFVRLCKILFARLEEQPLRILFSIAFFALLGSCVFGYAGSGGAMAPTNKDAFIAWSKGTKYEAAYPRFNPVIYSLENGLPLVKLGQDDKWAPDPSHRSNCWIASYSVLSLLRWCLILAGWVQATVLASAIGSRFKN